LSLAPNYLWAKSANPGERADDSMRLAWHLADVHDAAIELLNETGDAQLLAIGLDPEVHRMRFRRCVLLAAALHDLGKANDHFQDMLLGKRDVFQKPQGLRHEWVSVLLVRAKLRDWLLPAVAGCTNSMAIVEWAIGGHHPAYLRESPPRPHCPKGEGPELSVLMGHSEFSGCLQVVHDRFPVLGPPPVFCEQWKLNLVGDDSVFFQITQWNKDSERLWETFSDDDRRFTAAVKASLVGADVAGSALPRHPKRATWIRDAFSNSPKPGDLTAIVDRRLNGRPLREFQQNVAIAESSVVLAKGGCGSGKTLAAYHWAATKNPTKRLYFCYPTTGTATEGFRDYLFASESQHDDRDDETVRAIKSRLFHGRAKIDMGLIVKHDEQASEIDAVDRIESLDSWSTPVVSCTVDTVLGLIQNIRRGIYAWPALAGAAFVFDEIHAYDEKLFGALLQFLENLPGVPVLLMTASLPNARLIALRKSLKRAKRTPMVEVSGPEDLETLPRYHSEQPSLDLAERIRKEIRAGGKVLWVSNTVKRAITASHSIADLNPTIYHSRFRYGDRVQRHAAVIQAFHADAAAVACATQVAEMSLDISATLLLTDLAPVPALIQRLGRLNRTAAKTTRPFIILDPGTDILPYSVEELQAARAWLADLPSGFLSQRELAQAWERHDTATKSANVASNWLEGGPSTEVGELRKASPGITVILEEDANAVLQGTKALAEVTIPMPPPNGLDWQKWPRYRGIPIATSSDIEYDAYRGALWRKS